MSYKDKIIEFLTLPENMSFLLEIKPLIEKAMNVKYKKCYDKFLKEYLLPLIWSNYSTKIVDDTLVLENDNFKGDEYFRIHIHVGQRAYNNWYGLYGNETLLANQSRPQFQKLSKLLKELEVTRRDKWTLAWKFLPRNREELLTLEKEEIDDLLIEWRNIFWEFAENIKNAVEAANEVI